MARMLTVKEVARKARRSEETVRRWAWSGRLHSLRDGRRLIFDEAEVNQLVARERGQCVSLQEWLDLIRPIWRKNSEAGRPYVSASDLVIEDRRTRD